MGYIKKASIQGYKLFCVPIICKIEQSIFCINIILKLIMLETKKKIMKLENYEKSKNGCKYM